MIRSIDLKLPEFGLDISRTFTPGINLIEEDNGYGKTSIISMILSIYTKQFRGIRGLPDGTCKVETDSGNLLFSKKMWIGADDKNPLMKYSVPGEFFSLNTPEQRKLLVELFDIDKVSFMQKLIPNWTDTLLKEKNGILKENIGRKDIIISDIKRYEFIIRQYETNPPDLEDNTQELWNEYRLKVHNANAGYNEALAKNNEYNIQRNRIRSEISHITMKRDTLVTKREDLKKRFTEVSSSTTCPTCNGILPSANRTIELNKINEEGLTIKQEIESYDNILNGLNKQLNEVPADLPLPTKVIEYNDINVVAKELGKEVKLPTMEAKAARDEYAAASKELPIKKDQLKKLDELNIQIEIDEIIEAEKKFTALLEKTIKETGLEIDLFKTLKNGETVETFSISLNGKPYSELSLGQRLILNVRMAKLFAKKCGSDFIMIDEAGTLSEKNLNMIVEELEGFQVLLFRATPFQLKKSKKK